MRLILLGAPGAGKGTQADFLVQYYHIPKIATGDMLRAAVQAKTGLGRKIKQIMDVGDYVSDEIMIELVEQRISQSDCDHGFLLDGFPRTIPQAEALNSRHISIDIVLEIQVDDEIIVERLSGRLIHPGSNRIYHTIYHPPKVEGKDDVTGERLIQREDDKEETVRKRLSIYHEQTAPLIHYYKSMKGNHGPYFVSVSGVGDVKEVSRRILKAIQPIEAQLL